MASGGSAAGSLIATRPFLYASERRQTWRAFLLSLTVHAVAALGMVNALSAAPPAAPPPMQLTWIALEEPSAAVAPVPTPAPAQVPAKRPPKAPSPITRIQPHPAHPASAHPRPTLVTSEAPSPPSAPATPAPSPAEPTAGQAVAAATNTTAAAASGAGTSAPATITPPQYAAAYLRNPAPAYPAESRRNGEEGQVLLRIRVLSDGQPETIQLHRSSGHERLDQAALAVVRHWRFTPARQGDLAVAAWVIVPIQFSLRGVG